MKVANEINSCREDVAKYLRRYYANSKIRLSKVVIHGDFGEPKIDKRYIQSISCKICISTGTSIFLLHKKEIYITKTLFNQIRPELPLSKHDIGFLDYLNFTPYYSKNYDTEEFILRMTSRKEIIDNFLKS